MSVRRLSQLRPTQFADEAADSSDPAPRDALPTSATSYLAGEVVADRYRLIKELGRGGMGVVWEARSLALEVNVALKLIRGKGAESEASTRMAREAQAAARLSHPALVRVFDFGWTNRGNPFLVMELVQGETLSTVLSRDGRLGPIRAVQMLLPVADGLRCAHEKGIVHRDIKPENVFIAQDPFGRLQPKLLDFGIARLKQPTIDHRLTQVGVVMGSPEYMSPEQARGEEDVDERSDVWSMSVMLYEMISAQMPFQDLNYNALIQAILHREPTPTHALGSGDEALWRIIAKGLAKDRSARFQSVTELGGALAHWLYEHGIKEDLCGNSIRALWLDAGFPRLDAETARLGPAFSQRETERRTHTPQNTVALDVPVGPLERFRKRPWLVLTGASLALAVAWGFARSADSRESAAPAQSEAHFAAASVLARAPAEQVVAPTSAPSVAATVEPSQPTSVRAQSNERGAAPRNAAVPKTRAPMPAKDREKQKTIRDFGF